MLRRVENPFRELDGSTKDTLLHALRGEVRCVPLLPRVAKLHATELDYDSLPRTANGCSQHS